MMRSYSRVLNLQIFCKSMKGDLGGAKLKSNADHKQPNPKNKKAGSASAKVDPTKVQDHLSRSRLAAAQYRPDIQAQVEMLIGAVKHLAPSLDSRPSFVPEKSVKAKSSSFSASSFSSKPVAASEDRVDPEASSDEEFDEKPRPGYVFRWRRDGDGVKYNVEEKLEQETGADLVYRYVRDEATGRSSVGC